MMMRRRSRRRGRRKAPLHYSLDHRVGTHTLPGQAHNTPGTFPPATGSALRGT